MHSRPLKGRPKIPGQNSIGTGGQNSIGADTRAARFGPLNYRSSMDHCIAPVSTEFAEKL